MLPQQLIKLLDAAKKSVLTNPKGELILPVREKIWNLFGEDGFKGNGIVVQTNGLKRRAKLDILAVHRVMHIWASALPNDKSIIGLLKMVDDYFNGEIERKSLEPAKDRFSSTVCDGLVSHSDNKVAIASYVGYATARAVSTVVFDKAYYCDEIEEDVFDDDLGADEWETSYYASLAYVGPPYPFEEQNEVSITKRREFWMWYITKAIPEAYSAFSDN